MVWVRKDFWERVTERDELVGRFSTVSRLPQYLVSKIVDISIHGFNRAARPGMWKGLAYLLDDSDVDRRSRAGAVNLRRTRHIYVSTLSRTIVRERAV